MSPAVILAVASLVTAFAGLFGVCLPILFTARGTHRIVNQQRTDT